jgi:hypothetical protein
LNAKSSEEREGERECQSSHTCRSAEDGRLSTRGGSGATGLRTFRRPQEGAGLTAAWERKTTESYSAQTARSCWLPTERRRSTSRGALGLFQDWQRTQTQSSVTARKGPRQSMDVRFCEAGTNRREAYVRTVGFLHVRIARSSVARVRRVLFPLDKDLHGGRQPFPNRIEEGLPINQELCLARHFFDRRLPQDLPNIYANPLNGIVSIAEPIPLWRVGLCSACHIRRPGGNHDGTRPLKAGDKLPPLPAVPPPFAS